ncbi:MAG: cytidylate kinase-like family protein [Eubacterium sp.]|nr:cytidylate kinase-like family protein [Eubacterium sp.]
MKKENLIITIGRELGSGGHIIGERLAEYYGIPLYDRDLLKKVSEENDIDYEELEGYEERPVNVFLSRTVNGFSSSLQDAIAHLEFDFIKEHADLGESFVVVGRCAEEVLKGYDNAIKIFVLGDFDAKVRQIMWQFDLNEDEAIEMIHDIDKRRKGYHNHYCETKWGDSRNYDISINSSRLGIEGTADFLKTYIDRRLTAD